MINKIKFTKKKNILWVDDDIQKPALEPDRDELIERNCTIIDTIEPNAFLKRINNNNENDDGSRIDCFIVDAMLPNGCLSSKETMNTTRTGLVLIKKLFESGKYENVPIVVYSVVDKEEIKVFCSQQRIPLDRVTILNKSMRSREFADRVVEIVEPEQFQTPKDE